MSIWVIFLTNVLQPKQTPTDMWLHCYVFPLLFLVVFVLSRPLFPSLANYFGKWYYYHLLLPNWWQKFFLHLFILFCLLIFIYLVFYWRILLFSVKPQHEPAIGIHIFPPFWTSLPSPSPCHPLGDTVPLFEFLEPHSKFPLAIYFYTWQCKFPCYSFHTSHPLLPSPHVHKFILYFSIAAL